MKAIDAKELKALESAINFIEAYTDYYYDDIDDPDSEAARMCGVLTVLKGVMGKKDFKPKTKVIEKKSITDEELKDMLSTTERHARESVDPLFKYCVCNSRMTGTLYLTDDYGKALEKAKSQSISNSQFDFFEVFSIGKIDDGSYKLFREGVYNDGEFTDQSDSKFNDREFLHFDYIRNLFHKIEKI